MIGRRGAVAATSALVEVGEKKGVIVRQPGIDEKRVAMVSLAADLLAFPIRAASAGLNCISGISQGSGAQTALASPSQRAGMRRMVDKQRAGDAVPRGNGGRAGRCSGILAWMIGGLAREAFDPRDGLGSLLRPVRCWPDLIQLIVPGHVSRVAWTEFGNKLNAFLWFTAADSTLELPGHGEFDLARLVQRVGTLNLYEGLWTTEGLGYYCAAAALQERTRPRSLLAECVGQQLPAGSLVPLHTGMGLAFASRCLEGCTRERSGGQIREELNRFRELCQQNARAGYAGASMEALGLITRLLRPGLVPALDQQLVQMNGELRQRFWHGAGRALYFGSASALPCGNVIWPSLRSARSEPPHEEGRRNAVAGLALALTLVNLRHPEVLERYLECFGGPLAENDAFANGVHSSLLIWSRWAPISAHTAAILRHRPSRTLASHWDALVRVPVLDALECNCQRVGEENWPSEIFRYVPRRQRKA